jgi:hypothetical protein
MARRRVPDPPVGESPLPVGLRRENVTVESFVSWDEQPLPEYGGEDPRFCTITWLGTVMIMKPEN